MGARSIVIGIPLALTLIVAATALPLALASEHPVVTAQAFVGPQCDEWRYSPDYALGCVSDGRLLFTSSTWFVHACAGAVGGVAEWMGFDGVVPAVESVTLGPGECAGDHAGRSLPGGGCAFARVTFTPIGGAPVADQDAGCGAALV